MGYYQRGVAGTLVVAARHRCCRQHVGCVASSLGGCELPRNCSYLQRGLLGCGGGVEALVDGSGAPTTVCEPQLNRVVRAPPVSNFIASAELGVRGRASTGGRGRHARMHTDRHKKCAPSSRLGTLARQQVRSAP